MAHDCTISRRSFVAGTSALAGLAAVAGATKPSFGIADDATPYEEGVTEVWGHCAINCPGRCALKFHVKDGEVLWVDTYSNPTNDLDDPQPRACLRGRSYRRWMNNPDRINYPMKRVEGTKRGDGQYEQISWDEALQTIAEKLRYVIDTYGNEAVYNNYATGVSATTARPINRLMNLLGGRLSYYGSYSTAESLDHPLRLRQHQRLHAVGHGRLRPGALLWLEPHGDPPGRRRVPPRLGARP